MKLTTISKLLFLGIAVGLTATGCKHDKYVTPLPNGAGPGRTGPGRGPGGGDSVDPGGQIPGGGAPGSGVVSRPDEGLLANLPGSHKGWPEDASILKTDIVYFDFDQSAVRPSEKSKVAAVAEYLKSNPANAVRIEGNCDELGTDGYNMALGDRRANAVREELAKLGIDPTRIDTISYGREKPAVPGRDEASRSKNRRDEFVVLTPPAR